MSQYDLDLGIDLRKKRKQDYDTGFLGKPGDLEKTGGQVMLNRPVPTMDTTKSTAPLMDGLNYGPQQEGTNKYSIEFSPQISKKQADDYYAKYRTEIDAYSKILRGQPKAAGGATEAALKSPAYQEAQARQAKEQAPPARVVNES
jgi:hypothetical protein